MPPPRTGPPDARAPSTPLNVCVSAVPKLAISFMVSLIRTKAPETYFSILSTMLVIVVCNFSNTAFHVSTIVPPIVEKVSFIVSHAPDQSPWSICIHTVSIPEIASKNIWNAHFIISKATEKIPLMTSHAVPT